ncbi:hypothetical protein BCR33DRAFT_445800 [Rhizoclosmatium globosum]|uniref:Uncharacterized protein n=1 Tax=Rhizoclosmatium globosum TaxID=329046 RepID=A0A1Y2BSP0_9FUNG|nr:hypothetical protein BCR33DRAFT_445800 [Rhizoclosmatium globosum]|eukprot:ORY37772.1 hypothetical protein BCR33DRAFT_445800 [Rhizoclosmatium globosum]
MHLLIKRVVTIILESSLEYLKERENILDITGPGISKKVVWEYLKDVKKVDLKEISNLHHGFKLLMTL